MEIRNNSLLLANLLASESQKKGTEQTPVDQNKKAPVKTRPLQQDIVAVKKQHQGQQQNTGYQPKQTQLVAEDIKKTDEGYRRTQEFANPDGRKFTRIEDVATSANRTRRVVIQQNVSGSTTALEDVLDRQSDGTFRLTRRYTDEAGKTETTIKLGVTPDNANILLGRAPDPRTDNTGPFNISRGTQFDTSA